MNIAAILASPHGFKGNSSVLAAWLLWQAERMGARIVGVSLSDAVVEPCQGCDRCFGADACVMTDDYRYLAQVVENADGVVLISPMQFFGCSSHMKTFIDRSRPLLLRQAWKGKYAATVMTSGGTDCRNASEHLLGFLQEAGCWTVGGVHASVSSWRDPRQMERSFQAARELGRRLTLAIENQQVFDDQQAAMEAYRDHLRHMAVPRSPEVENWLPDWERWEKVS